MKAIVFLLALALAFVCAQAGPGGYSDVDLDDYNNSDTLKGLLDFAQTEFAKKAYQDGEIASPDLHLGKVVSVQQQVVAGLNVKYNVEMVDDSGKATFVTLVVFYQPWTGIKELTSYDISKNPQF